MNIIKYFKNVSFILTIIGALNWGLVGLLDLDLVQFIFGKSMIMVRGVYILIAASALFLLLDALIIHRE